MTFSYCSHAYSIVFCGWNSNSVTCVCHQRRYVCTGLHWAPDHFRDSVQEARGRRHRDAVLCRAADDIRSGALWWSQVAVFPQVFCLCIYFVCSQVELLQLHCRSPAWYEENLRCATTLLSFAMLIWLVILLKYPYWVFSYSSAVMLVNLTVANK